MKNKRKGFSIAELLIALLIISIVLSAAIPAITKKNTAGGEKIWRWAGKNNSAYFGVGKNQSAIIGAEAMPELDKYFYLDDDSFTLEDVNFTTDGDKLVLLKRNDTDKTESKNFQNSHITFYTIDGDTDNDIHYAGRLALDRHNIALGIGALQNINPISLSDGDADFKGYNTAVGHYSLFNNRKGIQNTAVGERALIWNNDGSGNTAIGYSSLSGSAGETEGGGSPSNSTAIGAFALQNSYGTNNTAVGSNALRENEAGEGNTAIGVNSCRNLDGDYNICIGYNAGTKSDDDDESSGETETGGYAFYLGTKTEGENVAEAALLQGHTSQESSAGVKDFAVNVDNFQIRTHNSGGAILNVDTSYDTNFVSGKFDFIFRDPRTTGGIASVLHMQEYCNDQIDEPCTGTAGEVLFMTSDMGGTARNLSFNGILNILFPSGGSKTVELATGGVDFISSPNNEASLLKINNKLLIDKVSDFNLDITTSGFLLQNTKDASAPVEVIKAQDGLLQLQATDNLIFNGGTKNYIQMYSANGVDIAQPGQEHAIRLNSSGLIEADSLILNQLSSHSQGNLKFIIDDLYQKVSATSDIRLKNILGDSEAGLKEITALEIKNYTYKNDEKKTPHVGVIAQQLQKIFPNSVFKGDDGYLRITKDEMFYAMINSIKELLAKIQDLTAKITGLDKRITELEKQNQQLKKQNAEFEKRLSKLEKKVK